MVLLLFESPAGFALFKVLKGESKLKEAETEVRWQRPLPAPRCMHKGGMHDGGSPRNRRPTRLQDMWKDFETLDAAQKVRA